MKKMYIGNPKNYYNSQLTDCLKANFKMKITHLEKVKDEKGKEILRELDNVWVNIKKKSFLDSVEQTRKNGIERQYHIVNSQPKGNIKVGDIYILADGSKAWLFNILVDRTK
jgi:hypothetical protein